MNYVFASMNVLKAGELSVEQRRKDWATIAKMFLDCGVDIISLQEVFHEKPVEMLRELLSRYSLRGDEWASDFKYQPTVRNDYEGYAFLWNTRTISLLVDERGKTYQPLIQARYSRTVKRPPYVGRFMPAADRGPLLEFRIINTHLIFGKDAYKKEQDCTDSDLKLRLAEYEKLSHEIFAKVSSPLPEGSTSQRIAYTFINGDYNLLLNRHCRMIDGPLPASDDSVQTLRSKRISFQCDATTISSNGQGYTNNDYDHCTSSGREGEYLTVSRISGPEMYCNGNFDLYRRTISDHVPIFMIFNINPRRG